MLGCASQSNMRRPAYAAVAAGRRSERGSPRWIWTRRRPFSRLRGGFLPGGVADLNAVVHRDGAGGFAPAGWPSPLCWMTSVRPSRVATPPCTCTWNLSALIFDFANLARMADFELRVGQLAAPPSTGPRAGGSAADADRRRASRHAQRGERQNIAYEYSASRSAMLSRICARVRVSLGFLLRCPNRSCCKVKSWAQKSSFWPVPPKDVLRVPPVKICWRGGRSGSLFCAKCCRARCWRSWGWRASCSGSSGGGQFLLVLPGEAREPADAFPAAAARADRRAERRHRQADLGGHRQPGRLGGHSPAHQRFACRRSATLRWRRSARRRSSRSAAPARSDADSYFAKELGAKVRRGVEDRLVARESRQGHARARASTPGR